MRHSCFDRGKDRESTIQVAENKKVKTKKKRLYYLVLNHIEDLGIFIGQRQA